MKLSLLFLALAPTTAAFVIPAASPTKTEGTALFARRLYEKVSRPDYLFKSLLVTGISVPLLKSSQQTGSSPLFEASVSGQALSDEGAPFAFSKPRSVAMSELREVIKRYNGGGMRIKHMSPDVVQIGYNGQGAAVEFVVGDREMRARPMQGDCNGIRLINGFADELASRQGWRTFGYPLICEVPR